MTSVEIVSGSIVDITADAIVNAANEGSTDGGGVCGVIFRAAGKGELWASCKVFGGCATGQAVITPSHRLAERGIKHIIHTVGPRWGDHPPETCDALLESSYRSSLEIAESNGLLSIAFPPISTGIFNFPKDRGADIAVRVTKSHQGSLDNIYLVAVDDEVRNILESAMQRN